MSITAQDQLVNFKTASKLGLLNVIFRFFSAGTYYPHSLFFCFLAFTGLTGMYKIVASELRKRNGFLLAAIFCMPSVLFWTSGVIKESFLVFAIGMMMYFLKKIAEKK